jgi:hypothetical protein
MNLYGRVGLANREFAARGAAQHATALLHRDVQNTQDQLLVEVADLVVVIAN